MKFEVWVFIENWRVEFNIWALRIWIWKFGKNFWIKNLGFRIFENFERESFFLVHWVNSIWLSWHSLRLSLSVGAEFWLPTFLCLTLVLFLFFVFFCFCFCFIFLHLSSSIVTIHYLLPLGFSSSSHHFFSQQILF